ncbi:HEAT repeat domain-containing protein [Streptomyces sp. NPDC007088]|uniref:HEAT repeat domain-containing protein n=1 Tax=Streptomyces sp. NPDC007088 TaxID=3364773 RepID=UPI0036CA15C0
MFEPVIAPSGTLLGLLQRGRGDGTLHALTAPRAEALAALDQCVCHDPRADWQVENRSLYYARLYLDLDGALDRVGRHLLGPEDLLDPAESRTGLALSVLGHLASYGRSDALALLRRYAAQGVNWAWALDELAVRDEDEALRALAAPVLARFPEDPEGEADLTAAVRDSYEPRPWRLWAEDTTSRAGARVRGAFERGSFDRWQRQLTPSGPRPGWSVEAILDWAEQGLERGTALHVPAARCLVAVAGPQDRAALLTAARHGADGARCAALRYLADSHDPLALDLVEEAALSGSSLAADVALDLFERMASVAAVDRARRWAHRPDRLGAAAGRLLACRGGRQDAPLVLGALREAVRGEGTDHTGLGPLLDGAGRLGIVCAAPVLRHVYRETSSSHLRGRAARALATTDASFAAGFAVECLWDCEESTREIAARHAETADARVVAQLRRLATDPAEEDEVQTAVRGRIGPDTAAA